MHRSFMSCSALLRACRNSAALLVPSGGPAPPPVPDSRDLSLPTTGSSSTEHIRSRSRSQCHAPSSRTMSVRLKVPWISAYNSSLIQSHSLRGSEKLARQKSDKQSVDRAVIEKEGVYALLCVLGNAERVCLIQSHQRRH